jgi:hypothetical protein
MFETELSCKGKNGKVKGLSHHGLFNLINYLSAEISKIKTLIEFESTIFCSELASNATYKLQDNYRDVIKSLISKTARLNQNSGNISKIYIK